MAKSRTTATKKKTDAKTTVRKKTAVKKKTARELEREVKIKKCKDTLSLIKEDALSLRNALKKNRLSSEAFYKWLEEDEENQKQFARARESRQNIIFEQCLTIADDEAKDAVPFVGKNHIDRAKLRIETRLKVLSRMNPKKYGDKIEHDVKTDVKISFK